MTTLPPGRLTSRRSASRMPSPSPSMSIRTISGFFLRAAWAASSVASPSATMLSLLPPSASWMPRRNSGWLSNRATRMRSAKGGLQLIDLESRRIGDGIGTDFDQELAADRLDTIVEGPQPLRIVCHRGLASRAFHFHLQQIAGAFGAHGPHAGALIQGLAHEAVEASLDGKGDLVGEFCQVTDDGAAAVALVAAHCGCNGICQRQFVEPGGTRPPESFRIARR